MKVSKKYDDIVTAAKKLFFKYGLKKVTIEEICVEAGVSKMTFYKFFPNKTEIAKKIIDEIYEQAITEFQTIMQDETLTVLDRANQWLETKKRSLGMASKDFISEIFMSKDTEIVEYLEAWNRKSTDISMEFIRDAQQKGWIRDEFNPLFLLIVIDKLNELSMDSRLPEVYGENISGVTYDITKLFLYGIMEDKNQE